MIRISKSFHLVDSREYVERIRKNLQFLDDQPDVQRHCYILLERGENAVIDSISSPDAKERMSAIYVMVCLVELNSAEENNLTTRFARRLLKSLTNVDERATRLASRAIVYLIQTSKTYATLMEQALNQCCEQLEETQRSEERLLAAVILARDLAFFTPSQFFPRIPQFFYNIYKVIRDPKMNVREAAIRALQAALVVVLQREAKHKNEWYKRCFDEACNGRAGREEIVHGSLLIFNELLRIANATVEKMRLRALDISTTSRSLIGLNPVEWLTAPADTPAVESRTARALVTEHYLDVIVRYCMELRNVRSVHCQLVLLEIFPRLCYFTENSERDPFNDMLAHAISQTKKLPNAWLTIGLMAVIRSTDVQRKVPEIMRALDERFAPKKKPIEIEMNVFKCLTLIIRSQKNLLKRKIHAMLPSLFATDLSEGLIEVLKETVECIPELKVDVFDGLLEQLYQLLMNCPRPNKLAAPTPPPVPTEPIQPTNIRRTKLALRTFGDFDFQRHALQMFMRYIAQGYLTSDSVEIRLASVYCCAEMVKPFVRVHEITENQQKIEVYRLIKNVLECLARTAAVDAEVEVRLSVLKCFSAMDVDFLYHLAQEDVLETIFMTLYDEDYRMQEEAILLLSRIADLNPAMILPKLRKVVLESISQLINSYVPKLEEHSAKIIAKLSIQSPKFMSPYLSSVLMALLPHLQPQRRSKVEVTVQVMNALSELSLIGGLELVRSVDKIFPSLIGFLHDSTSLNRREAALRALGVICQSTGYVVDPYKDYLDLLDILLKLLKTELSPSMRHLTMRVMGVIGALDPYTHKVYLGKIYSHRSNTLALSLPNINKTSDNKSDVSDIQQWINYERCTLLEYYPALTIANLVEILQDDALTSYHQEVVNALSQIFKSLGSKSSKYAGQVVPKLLKIIENSKPELRKFFLGQFSKFAAILGQELRPNIKEILEMTARAWNWKDSDEYCLIIISVLEEIGRAFGSEFTPYVTDLCPYLLDIIENDRSEDKRLVVQALSCVVSVVRCVGAHIHLILPPILSVLDDRLAPLDVRMTALDTLILLARTHPIEERAPTIMQTWLRAVVVKQLQPRLMELLHLIIREAWGQFLVYKNTVNAALIRCKVDAKHRQEYQEHVAQVITMMGAGAANGAPIPRLRERRDRSDSAMPTQRQQSTTTGGREHRHLINVDQLRRFWSVHTLNSRNDWLQWLTTLRAQFIRQSPSAFIRACANLADSHEPLAKSLFNAAFMSVWTEINEFEQDELSNQLIDVLTSCPHAEPIQAILNLAEFMDHSEKGPLPVTHGTLSKCAEMTRAYAKAIRYKELEIIVAQRGEPNPDDCQALITYANKLNVEEYAAGVVQYAEKMGMDISGRWYEKLGEWNKALEMYQIELSDRTRNQSQRQTPSVTPVPVVPSGFSLAQQQSVEEPRINKEDIIIHQMRCLEALGRWKELLAIGQNTLDFADSTVGNAGSRAHHPSGNSPAMRLRRSGTISGTGYLNATLNEAEKHQRIAQMAARASWASGDYDSMSKYVQRVNQNTQEGAFLRAVLAIKNNEFKDAMGYITKVREMYDSDLTAMAAESYERAYGAVVVLQQLTELEETIEYKMIPERRPRIALLWSRRLQGCRQNIAYWQRIIHVRSIVMSQTELRPTWIKFAAMCRRQGRLSMARNVLASMMNVPADSALFPLTAVALDEHSPQLAFAIFKQLWIEGQRKEALVSLEGMALTLHRLIDRRSRDRSWTREQLEASARMTAKCYLKLGEWHALVQTATAPLGSAAVGSAAAATVSSAGARRGSITVPASASVGFNLASGGLTTAGIHTAQQSQQHIRQQQQQQLNQQRAYTQSLAQIEQQTSVILKYYANATKFNPNWYKAWHRLATTYYNLVMADRQTRVAAERLSPLSAAPAQQPTISAGGPIVVNDLGLVAVQYGNDPALLAQYQQQQQLIMQGMVAEHPPPIGYVAPVGAYLPLPSQVGMPLNVAAVHYEQRYVPPVGVVNVTQNVTLAAAALPVPYGSMPQGQHPTTAMPPPAFYQAPGGDLIAVAPGGPMPPASAIQATDADAANYHVIDTADTENTARQQHVRFDLDVEGQAPLAGEQFPVGTAQPAAATRAPQPVRQQLAGRSASGYAAHAVRYFFKAMQLAEAGSRLDDTLRLLMLWFDYGERPDVFEVLHESLRLVPMESWLEVMPQLIARLDSHHNTGALVKQLVIDISKVHPQALIYALTAAAKSRNSNRSRVAREILEFMTQTRPVLVEQAQMLNDELIRCAILWHELWHEALEDASRFYFQEHSVENMMNVLRPLHAKIMQGHETLKEQSFIQTYYKELNDAFNHCEAYLRNEKAHEMQQAWELYFGVFKRISAQLRMITVLDLNYISPRLAAAQNLELTVPGTYEPNAMPVTIVSLHHHLQVIASKQRPRKIYMKGSDGKEYAFLLKGHEDPRQDERVMQLFGLLNTLILRDPDTCRRNISIQRYSITTLSQTSGLIGWLPSCDTLYALIKDYREKRGINLSDEHLRMQNMVADLDKVTLIQKVEVFEETLIVTAGDDLRQALWMKSPNSEVWFERRTNYTRSMACMSMVGYVLGLGDRHPSNLMLDRMSGKIVHIDFGDCFEVAMIREKFPEKIPFRLTRMLVKAMEVTGIEGNYRLTCERVLRLLRNSNDSILAVLEAFVYDPVVNWRLAEGINRRRNDDIGRTERQESGRQGDSDAINRVKAKLCGRDFSEFSEIIVSEQVNRLIEQATLNENLCQCYVGWCPFW